VIHQTELKTPHKDSQLCALDFCILQVSGNPVSCGLITGLNENILELTGFQKHELLFQSLKTLLPKFLADRFEQWAKQKLDNGEFAFQKEF
jgi:hypothetical protein